METRQIESRILLIQNILNGRNKLVKEILRRTREDKNNLWNRKLEEYLKKVDLKYENIAFMSPEEIKKK